MTYSPGIQIPDGRAYRLGLIPKWSQHARDGFAVYIKARQVGAPAAVSAVDDQTFLADIAAGWQAALAEARGDPRVKIIRLALIPAWKGGEPDWGWIESTITWIASSTATTSRQRISLRLGNYRDGKNEGCSFEEHAQHEWRFGQILSKSPRLFWSVGDDRGIVASVKGWRERKAAYQGWMPDLLEWQDYGLTGLTADHIGLAQDALHEAGFVGGLALVEHHRWFPGGDQNMGDLPELFTAETGEYLLSVWEACRDRGIGYHMFTGDMAFDSDGDLNPVGLALFNRPRPLVKAWRPPALKAWWRGVRLGG